MNKGLNLSLLKVGLPFLLIPFLFLLSKSAAFQKSPADLSLGILLDLIITLPLIYFLLIRKSKIPKITALYVFVIGILLAGLIIPIEHQTLLVSIKHIARPTIEICIISIIGYKILKLSKSFNNIEGVDFYDKLLVATKEIFPGRVGELLASEVAVFYYLFNYKKPIQKGNEFSYFKKSGIVSIISVLIFLIVIETFVVHLLLERWNPTVAWVMTILSIYTLMQITAILRSMKHRLIFIDYKNQVLNLKYGFASHTNIPFDLIKGIEKTQRSNSKNKHHVSLSNFDMLDSKNVTLHLKEENIIHRIYGIKKNYTSIAIFLDDRDTFAEAIENIIKKDSNF